MKKLKFFIALVFVGGFLFLIDGEALALNSDRLGKYSNYQIYFYDQDALNCIPRGGGSGGSGGSGATTLSGSSRAEKVWNYIVSLGISGLSDRPEAIAGVLGNMQVESGFDPFIQNSGGCTGIIQWCKGSWNDGFFSYMRNKGFDTYYHVGGSSGVSESVINDGISAELDFLFKNGAGGVTASKFVANLGAPSSKSGTSGARAYSDLFLVTVENAFGGSDTLEDSGVKGIAGHSTYQAASKRRASAESFYNLYGGGTSGGDSGGEDDEDEGDMEYCEEEPESTEGGGDENYDEPEAGNLVSYIKAWAWPTYSKDKTEKMPAYADYINTKATYKGDGCYGGGVDCGAFVANIIKASGWDTSYPQTGTTGQSSWLASNWKKVNVSSLRLGDVGIKPGHVILYVGSISGFNSNTASASQCDRAPMAGADKNLSNYTWYRKP